MGELKHRGPDAHDTHFSSKEISTHGGTRTVFSAAGHHRLSILDLNARANQPFCRDGKTLVYNGEVYNFEQLKSMEPLSSESFETTSDTEVVFRSLSRYGENAFHEMNGMWALCFFDETTGKLIASRDRYGKKPLFYYLDEETLCVASTISAISTFLKISPTFDPVATEAYIHTGTLFPGDTTDTHFSNIKQVPQGHNAVFDVRDWRIEHRRYFSWKDHIELSDPQVDNLSDLIQDSVRLRLVSDRKVGLLLSGGIDSTVILSALYTQKLQDNLFCFIGEAGRSEDAEYAKKCVDTLGIEATIIELDYGSATFERFLRMCKNFEKPFPLIGNSMAMSEMYEAISQHDVPVVLDGTGGDEIFGGYWDRQFPFAVNDAFQSWNTGWLKKSLLPNFGVWRKARKKNKTATSFDWALDLPFVHHPSNAVRRFVAGTPGPVINPDPLNNKAMSFSEALLTDITKGRLGEWIWQNDRNAMMFSIENRSPLLDYRLAPYAKTGFENKFVGKWNKHELRSCFDRMASLPTQWRQEKQGFRWASRKFFRENQGRILDLITSSNYLQSRIKLGAFADEVRRHPRYITSRLTPRLLCVAGLESTLGAGD